MIPIILVIIAFYIMIFIFLKKYYINDKERNQQIRIFTKETNKQPIKKINPPSEFKLLNKGIWRNETKNAFRCNIGKNPATIFDFSYSNNRESISIINKKLGIDPLNSQTVCLMETSKEIPEFEISPKMIKIALPKILRFDEINYEGYDFFNKNYYLRSKNKDKAKEFFRNNLLKLFNNNKIPLTIVSKNNKILFYEKQKLVNPKELNDFIEKVSILAGLMRL